MYSLMWLSTCWIPLVYTLKRIVNHKDVTSIVCYNTVDAKECDCKYISLNNIKDINEIKNDYARIRVMFNMNNNSFAYCALSQEFHWPIEEKYEHSWISKAVLFDSEKEIESSVDVTHIVNMYAGPSYNFYNSYFDFNWIPEIANSSFNELHIYDNNDFCYKINLITNTEINDTCEHDLLEKICGIKLLCRSTYDFETM